jgi:Cu+-exporting ATPase
MQKSHKYSVLRLLFNNFVINLNEITQMKKAISLILICVLFSCNETKKEAVNEKSDVLKQEVAANLKSIAVEIEGMTCEIGCARLIQSKLSKVEGVTYSKVNFESKKGQFTYDSNKLNQQDIVRKINGIAGGDLYLATNIVDLEEILTETK